MSVSLGTPDESSALPKTQAELKFGVPNKLKAEKQNQGMLN
ncbi:MAG TPA: hypothetical protein PLU68_00860 [Thermotogota bacterium]|nr:hypothetical protein [Thermotogota bacterium]